MSNYLLGLASTVALVGVEAAAMALYAGYTVAKATTGNTGGSSTSPPRSRRSRLDPPRELADIANFDTALLDRYVECKKLQLFGALLENTTECGCKGECDAAILQQFEGLEARFSVLKGLEPALIQKQGHIGAFKARFFNALSLISLNCATIYQYASDNSNKAEECIEYVNTLTTEDLLDPTMKNKDFDDLIDGWEFV